MGKVKSHRATEPQSRIKEYTSVYSRKINMHQRIYTL